MGWFWVSRARYEEAWGEMQASRQLVRECHAEMDKMRATVEDAHQLVRDARMGVEASLGRYDALLEKYHALRLMGGAPERKLEPLPIAKRDEIADAIELAAGNDSALQRHLNRFAKTQKLDGASEHDIIQAIIHWRSDDGDLDNMPRKFGVL